MRESRSHREAKTKAAGESGKTEVPIKGGRRLDGATSYRAVVEVERSGDSARLKEAAQRLKDSGKPQHVLIVPQKDMKAAQQAMREVHITGTVKNLSGTRRVYVGARTGKAPSIAISSKSTSARK